MPLRELVMINARAETLELVGREPTADARACGYPPELVANGRA